MELERLVAERTERLRQSEEKFSKAFRASPAAISIATLADGRWIEINEALATMTGYSTEELIGRTSSELGLVDAVARAKILEAIREHGSVRNVEIQMLTKSKEIVEVLVSVEQIELHGRACALTIQYDITELKRAEREVRRLNSDLEQRQVALEAANKELEAFSYSVAHDLRAPLRSIDGFSQAFLEDYADTLDAEGSKYLQHVRESAQEMGRLIDALLMLSRVTRSELHRERVNLSALASSVLARLQNNEPERKAELVISDGLVANGDARLLGVVLQNLLGNAWKFSGKCPMARIEVGARQEDGRPVFFVRDNGAGFDMIYAHKLFGTFQRLHSGAEFEGTGIGLATVQRIIKRHGGRVWAEGEVGRGATVSFTLNKEAQ
jgi:PAS domain S-box-containing protein